MSSHLKSLSLSFSKERHFWAKSIISQNYAMLEYLRDMSCFNLFPLWLGASLHPVPGKGVFFSMHHPIPSLESCFVFFKPFSQPSRNPPWLVWNGGLCMNVVEGRGRSGRRTGAKIQSWKILENRERNGCPEQKENHNPVVRLSSVCFHFHSLRGAKNPHLFADAFP